MTETKTETPPTTTEPAVEDDGLAAKIEEGVKNVIGKLLDAGDLVVDDKTKTATAKPDEAKPATPREEESRMEKIVGDKVREFLGAEAAKPKEKEAPKPEVIPGPVRGKARLQKSLWGA